MSNGEKQIICDSLPTITLEDMSNGSVGVATSTTNGDSYIYVSIPTDGLTTATIQDICAYFTTKPINIKYPLAVKVVSEVELSVTDQDDVTLESPLAYNSGNITLSSDSILPSLNYEVQSLNSFSNLKPNTVYTIKKNTQDFSSTYEIGDTTYTTSNTLTTTENNKVVVLTSTISDTDKVALIEGNNIGIDIPYFEGMQSVKQPILTTTGKNLYPYGDLTMSNPKTNRWYYTNGTTSSFGSSCKRTDGGNWFYLEKSVYSYQSISENTKTNIVLVGEGETQHHSGKEFPSGWYVFRFKTMDESVDYAKISQIQLEKGSNKTTYEPYKSNTLTCNEEVTLRGIGDVKDELNLVTGELTQRIGEMVLDGSEDWRVWSGTNGTEDVMDFQLNQNHSNTNDTTSMCDKFITYQNASRLNAQSNEGIALNANRTFLRINKSKLSSVDTAGLKQYLTQNPITVQYQLETESIKTVDLSIVDQDNVSQSNLQLQTQLSHITTSSDTLIPIFNISATNNYDVQIKPSTQYTVRLSQDVVGNQLSVDLGGTIQTVTSNEFTITTPSILVHEQLRIGGEGNVIGEIQLFEGNTTGLVNEYFDGMKVSKISILTTTGKNLFDVEVLNDRNKNVVVNNGTVVIDNYYSNQLGNWREIFGFLKPNNTYFYSCDLTYDGGSEIIEITGGFFLCKTVDDSTTYFRIPRNKAFTTPSDLALYDRVIIYGASSNDGVVTLKNIQFTESSVVTEYEPYKSNVLSTGEEVELGGIGDIKDELNLITGEYTKAIYKHTFTGNEDWIIKGGVNDGYGYTYFACNIGNLPIKYNYNNSDVNIPISCDKLPTVSYVDFDNRLKNVGINLSYDFRLNFSDCNSNNGATVEDLKAYLKANPTTVQYPISKSVKKVDLSIVDQDENAINAPLAYKNGHIQVTTSEIAPIVNYEIPTSNSYHLDLAVNGGTYTVKGDNTNELITHNSEPLISDDTHLMVIEGDCVSKDVPYFEGMTSVQTPKLIISNCPFAFGKGGRI